MRRIATSLTKAMTACAISLALANPAFAQSNERDRGIGVGEIIAGALVIGGVAALAGAFDNDGRHRDHRYDDRRYRNISSRSAVESCIRVAEQRAYRAGVRRVKVTDIREVDRKDYGYKVKGRIAVDNGYRGGRYGRGWDRDYRGWNNAMQGWDSGKFSCKVDRRGVRELDYSGLKGLR